jgi:hypothetical protein
MTEIEKLKEENARLRALVERASKIEQYWPMTRLGRTCFED